MAEPTNEDSSTWCGPIADILTLATGTTTYFDISQPNNPALDEFKKDWLKLQSLAGCVPHRPLPG